MANKVLLRHMEISDLDQILTLEQMIFTPPWFREHYEYELLENNFAHLYVLECEQEIVGYLGIWILFEECQITTIASSPLHRQKGYANRLMKHCIEVAKEYGCDRISLEVRVSNETAQALYRKYGFETISIRPRYYEDNHEDAYLMMKGI